MFSKIKSLFARKTLQDVSVGYSYNYAEIKKRIRILVIDDNVEHFPLESFRRDGYAVDHWAKVNSEDIAKLERGDFDVILLDIKGVADKAVSPKDGFGVLKLLKTRNPAQIVIAFSGQSFKLSSNEFWELTDGYIEKPTTFIECREKIDEIIKNKITISFFWGAARKILAEKGVSDSELGVMEKQLLKSIEGNRKVDTVALLGKISKFAEASFYAAKAIDKIYSLILLLP